MGPYLRAVRAHAMVVGAIVLAALAGAVAWLVLRSPDYEATAQILVSPLPQDDDNFLGTSLPRDSGDPTNTVQTAATLVESTAAATRTAQRMGEGWDTTRVLDSIAIEPEGESNIIAVTGTAESGQTAARLANTFANSSLEARQAELRRQVTVIIRGLRTRQERLAGVGGESAALLASRLEALESVRDGVDPTLRLSQPAAVPNKPVGLPAPAVVALALLAGLALAVAVAIALELLTPRVRDEDEAVGIYPLPVLVRVPKIGRRERRAGGELAFIIHPRVREAFRTIVVQLTKGREPESHVVMLTSASTGDGKTTSAVNLAASMAAGGHSTILMDLDIRKPDVARLVDVSTTPLSDLLRAEASGLKRRLAPAPAIPNLSVLATSSGGGPEGGALIEALNRRLPALIEEARELAEFVVLDTAPLGEVSDSLRITDSADDLLVVVRPGRTNRANFQVMRDLLERTGHSPAGLIVIGEAPGMSREYYGYGMSERPLYRVPPERQTGAPSQG